MIKKFIFIWFLFLQASVSYGQRNVKDSIIGTPWVSIQYGLNWTAGDLKERLGVLNNIGFFAGYKTKRNWIFGAEGGFLFGNKIHETGILNNLADSKGNITDQNGDIAIIRILSRGFFANAVVGKVIPVFNTNKNSGILLNVGIGYTAYKYRIETQENVVPQIELNYRKGYDRLTAGINTSQFIGYSYMANQGAFNFYGGFYIQEAFTQNQRNIFYDQPNIPVDKSIRTDILYGFKVGWMIPIYKRVPKEFYYN